MDRDYRSGPSVHTWPAEGVTLENINVEGEGSITFKTKKALQRYCNKHNLRSGALL
jgi:hypothetical protein